MSKPTTAKTKHRGPHHTKTAKRRVSRAERRVARDEANLRALSPFNSGGHMLRRD